MESILAPSHFTDFIN